MFLLNRNTEADQLFNQGISQYLNKEYEKAIETYGAALRGYDKVNERFSMAQVLNATGIAYNALKNYSEAVKDYLQALKILQELGDQKEQEGRSLNNLGIAYDYLSQYPEALDCYQKALVIFRASNNSLEQGKITNNLNYNYYLQAQLNQVQPNQAQWNQAELDRAQLEQALNGFIEALKIHQSTNNIVGQEIAYRNIRCSVTILLGESLTVLAGNHDPSGPPPRE